MAITLKTKPKEPVNHNELDELSIRPHGHSSDNITLQQIIDQLTERGLSPEQVVCDIDYGWDSNVVSLYTHVPAYSEFEFAQMMMDYNRKLAEYTEWYNKNRDKIEEAIVQREAKKKLQKELAHKKKLLALQNEKERLEEQIKKINHKVLQKSV